ncbi:hypothetical protein ACFFTN_12645 [Aminobacter aganoensis]|uniref:Uncharacterized protein n=1 Tax=Aminobacter aganoensis TaxID=83264 RepID=A0A7X0KM95_9HYPH|nr:hypothetical protein [Aminobacter aganoensis]MBB6355843.1 hypothetical protein [Aminobacter aganoensis]
MSNEKLVAASSRLAALTAKGERSALVELRRRIALVNSYYAQGPDGQYAAANDATGLRLAGAVSNAGSMREGVAIAVALLDELFELLPGEPQRTIALQIAEVFDEIRGMAERGAQAARASASSEND